MWSIECDDTYVLVEKIIAKYSSEYEGLIRTYFDSSILLYFYKLF